MSVPALTYPKTPVKRPPLWEFGLYSVLYAAGDMVTVVDAATIRNQSIVTIEVLIYPLSAGHEAAFGRIFSKAADVFRLFMGGGVTVLECRRAAAITDARSVTVAGVITANRWNRVTITYDDGGDRLLHILINGVEAAYTVHQAVVGALSDDSGSLYIGNLSVGNRTFDGYIHGPIWYNAVRTRAEIDFNRMNYPAPVMANMALWFPMPEGRGATVYDYSGQGNNGTLAPAPDWMELEKWKIRADVGL